MHHRLIFATRPPLFRSLRLAKGVSNFFTIFFSSMSFYIYIYKTRNASPFFTIALPNRFEPRDHKFAKRVRHFCLPTLLFVLRLKFRILHFFFFFYTNTRSSRSIGIEISLYSCVNKNIYFVPFPTFLSNNFPKQHEEGGGTLHLFKGEKSTLLYPRLTCNCFLSDDLSSPGIELHRSDFN